jgi:hypothetical protein
MQSRSIRRFCDPRPTRTGPTDGRWPCQATVILLVHTMRESKEGAITQQLAKCPFAAAAAASEQEEKYLQLPIGGCIVQCSACMGEFGGGNISVNLLLLRLHLTKSHVFQDRLLNEYAKRKTFLPLQSDHFEDSEKQSRQYCRTPVLASLDCLSSALLPLPFT